MWVANGRFASPGRPRSSDCTDGAQPADGTPGPAGWSRVDGQARKSTTGPYHWDGSKEQVGNSSSTSHGTLMPQDFPLSWPFTIGPHGPTGSSMAPRAGSRDSCSRPTAGLAWPSNVDHLRLGLSVDPAQSDVLVATTNALRLRRFVHRLGSARSSGRRSRTIVWGGRSRRCRRGRRGGDGRGG